MIRRLSFAATAALLALAGCAQTPAATAPAPSVEVPPVAPTTVPLQVSSTRSTTMTVWAPEQPRGVVLFSTGAGSWPERYEGLVDAMTREGFAVLAPLHVDSVRYPDRDRFTLQQSFPERLADMRAAAGYAEGHFAGLPVIAAGHSYGSLISFAEGGALAQMMPMRIPAVRAVLAFSSPGRIPGLIDDDSYAGVAVPLLEITGTEDVIPAQMGYPSQPEDHLLPVETSAATAYGLVLDGGDHGLVGTPELLARALPAVRLFLRGYGLDDADARARLAAWQPAGDDIFLVRERAE